jgi:hypothetical protein
MAVQKFSHPRLICGFIASSLLNLTSIKTAYASVPSVTSMGYQQVNANVGSQSGIDVRVYPGRMSTVDFSNTDETIIYLGLGDASRIVFNTDFPLESGAAKTVLLKPIQPLKFPGATTTKITNLIVKTADSKGQLHLYNFQIFYSQGIPSNLGIQITSANLDRDRNSTRINLGGGRTASLDDVEHGLRLAISKGYTSASDPVVTRVRNFLAIARDRSELSLVEVAKEANVDLAVITELARIAFEGILEPVRAATLKTDSNVTNKRSMPSASK